MNTINYIPVFYYGARMHPMYNSEIQQNKFYMVDKQIEALNLYHGGITLVTLAFNLDDLADIPVIEQEIKKRENNIKFKYELFFRQNKGTSYGAWDAVIKKNVDNFDYFFVTEDDFVPAANNFYQPFIDRCKDEIAYVCMYANKDWTHLGVPHAAIPHGVVRGTACKEVLSKQGNLFKIYTHVNSYELYYKIQVEFFEYFIRQGYVISDITDSYCSPYMDSRTQTIIIYGSEKNPVLFKPVPNP